jgi:ELWxxDGT repeat protein
MTRLGKRVLFITPIPYLTLPPPDLWATDGTESGTVRLFDGDVAGSLRVTGDTAFFCATADPRNEPQRLWRTDGTPAGTVPAFDRELSCTGELELSGSQLLFTATTRHTGTELWSLPLDPP